ncbi:ArnT family glycosyltransferase [Singulisphaera sp. PoT]|uniref:ArnT family glycosyltransferase n=1 Tax=Singulisphaera sp. PoT TaxID=3411797 RepID=UPI003BF4E194
MTPRYALFLLILISTLLRLLWAGAVGLGNDEAYHYLFTQHPDWSYFDHPPLLALVERLGILLAGGEATAFSVRLGFIALFAGSTWLMARLSTQLYGEPAGFFAALALNLTAYHSVAAGTFALPDGPLLFFWLLTLDRLIAAMETPERLGPWMLVGLAWGGALLSKYHAVFLPIATFLYFLNEPSARMFLKRPGPYVAVLIGSLLFAPVIFWNAQHDWVSFVFQGGRAVGELRFRPDILAGAVLGQMLYLFPWIWLSLVVILVQIARGLFRRDEGVAIERFLVLQSLVPLATFMVVACTRAVLPHWTLVGFLPLFPMLGRAWAAKPLGFSKRLRFLSFLMPAIAAVVWVQCVTGILQQGGSGTLGLLKVSRDPTLDLYGWDVVGRELRSRGLLDRPDTFVFTSSWYYSGHVGHAIRHSKTPVLCYNSWNARSFRFWSRPDEWLGKEGILVSLNNHSAEPHCYDRYFERIELIGEFAVERAGAPVRKVRLYRCGRQIKAFPFDGFEKTDPDRKIAKSIGKAKPAVMTTDSRTR